MNGFPVHPPITVMPLPAAGPLKASGRPPFRETGPSAPLQALLAAQHSLNILDGRSLVLVPLEEPGIDQVAVGGE